MTAWLAWFACASPVPPDLSAFDATCALDEDCALVDVPEERACSGCGGTWSALNVADAATYQELADHFDERNKCRGASEAGCAFTRPEAARMSVACEAGTCVPVPTEDTGR